MIYIITDTHLSHKNIIKYCGRPKNFSELILKNLKKTIKKNDILIHLGDICFGKTSEENKKLIDSIKGIKWLVKGNHDYESNEWYHKHGWDFVCDSFSITYKGKKILFSHKPMKGDFDLNIHGHLHNSTRDKWGEFLKIMDEKHILVSIENNNYKPVSLDEVIKKYEK